MREDLFDDNCALEIIRGHNLEPRRNGDMNERKGYGMRGAFNLFSLAILVSLFIFVLALGCAGKRTEVEFTSDDYTEPTDEEGVIESEPEKPKEVSEMRKGIEKAPSYHLFAKSLKHYERVLGIKFYKNEQGNYMPFSAVSWDSFSIADLSGQCLYEVEVLGVKKRKFDVVLDLDISQGPCGLAYPDSDAAVVEKVSMMEGSVISPELIDKLNGVSFCSDKRFLQKVLEVPFDLDYGGKDLEMSLDRIAQRVTNPLQMSFGDVVFFESYPGERSVGIYVGYGVVVYNTCFGAKVHHIKAKKKYRIYRLYNGFAMTHYKMHQDKLMMDYLGGTK